MRCSPRIVQNGFDFRRRRSSGRWRGIRYLPISEEALDLADASGREDRQVRAAIAIEKVEDVVAGRIRAGAERRPRDRRHGRKCRPQAAVASRLREARKIRQIALFHEAIGQRRILSVEADDDEPPDCAARRCLPRQQTPKGSKRPDENRRDGHHNRREHDEKRRENSEAGAGPDVRLGGYGCGQNQEEDEKQDEHNAIAMA